MTIASPFGNEPNSYWAKIVNSVTSVSVERFYGRKEFPETAALLQQPTTVLCLIGELINAVV